MVQISSSTEVGFLTALAGGITYFAANAGASISPETSAILGAIVAAITAYLSADNLASNAAAAAVPATK